MTKEGKGCTVTPAGASRSQFGVIWSLLPGSSPRGTGRTQATSPELLGAFESPAAWRQVWGSAGTKRPVDGEDSVCEGPSRPHPEPLAELAHAVASWEAAFGQRRTGRVLEHQAAGAGNIPGSPGPSLMGRSRGSPISQDLGASSPPTPCVGVSWPHEDRAGAVWK